MGPYFVRQCAFSVLTLVPLTLVFFLLLEVRGNPCTHYNAMGGSDLLYQHCLAARGLDQPLPTQYWLWLSALEHGDLGTDYSGAPLIAVIAQRLPATLILFGVSYLVQETLAVVLGLLGALKGSGLTDSALTALAYVLIAVPNFCLGFMLLLVFGIRLNWLPSIGAVDSATLAFGTGAYWDWYRLHPIVSTIDLARHLALPALTLAANGIGADSRHVRSGLLDTLGQDYVRTAHAKGLPRHVVVLKHALRNALLPLLTNAGLTVGAAFGGSIIVETLFGWPGVGQYYAQSLQLRDGHTLTTLLLLAALAIMLANVVTDLAYAWADPRIRYSMR